MSNWKRITLEECTDILGDGLHGTPKYSSEGECAFINGNNLMDGKVVIKKDTKRVSKEEYEKYKKPLNDRTIFVSINGTLGNVGIYDDEYIILGKSACYFNVKRDVDKDYIYYVVCSKNFKKYLEFSATGTTIKNISLKQMREYEFFIPDLQTQNKISSTLKLIDEKIRVNEQINDNLLQQVTACFHHYFDAYEASTDAIGSLGDMVQFKYGTMPKKDKLGSGEYVAFSGYQVVGSYPEKMFSTPQLIVVARGVGGCGDIKYTPSNCYLTNLSIAILSPNTAIEDYLFNYLRLHDTKVMNTGSAQPQITVSTLEKYQLPIPPEDLLASFSTFVQPFKTLYRMNKDEIERLQVLRDTLLPRLMSGELDVSNIDI